MDWSIKFESNSAHIGADADAALSHTAIPADPDGLLRPAVEKAVGVVPFLAASLDRNGTKEYAVELAGNAETVSISIRVVADQTAETGPGPDVDQPARREELERQNVEAIDEAEQLGKLAA